jgi:tRNA (guanine37-N1)-methyltransferase
MVMLAEPLAACLNAIRQERGEDRQTAPLVYFSPVGQTLNQALVQKAATARGAVLLCGRYEGVDQRFIDSHVDVQISLGDFVLSGGELAAMAWLDAVARLQPGVLHDEQSHLQDSFTPALRGLLDCPHYTRPEEWRGQGVPAPLLSGHHAQIADWRRAQSLALTAEMRPDLIAQARQQGLLKPQDEQFLKILN